VLRAIADTHAFVWYIVGEARLSATARAFIDGVGASGDQIGSASR
jgi:PIN domain nuclease of toxin-antitoxin system